MPAHTINSDEKVPQLRTFIEFPFSTPVTKTKNLLRRKIAEEKQKEQHIKDEQEKRRAMLDEETFRKEEEAQAKMQAESRLKSLEESLVQLCNQKTELFQQLKQVLTIENEEKKKMKEEEERRKQAELESMQTSGGSDRDPTGYSSNPSNPNHWLHDYPHRGPSYHQNFNQNPYAPPARGLSGWGSSYSSSANYHQNSSYSQQQGSYDSKGGHRGYMQTNPNRPSMRTYMNYRQPQSMSHYDYSRVPESRPMMRNQFSRGYYYPKN